MPPRAPGCAAPRHVPLGKLQSDAWAGELERMPEVVVCRGKWLAAAVVLPHLRACRSSGLSGARGAPRRGFLCGALVWPSRRAPPAGALVLRLSRPGKLLLPGPCRLGPESSSCRTSPSWPGKLLLPGLGLLGSITWPSSGPERAVETLVAPLASLAAGRYYCPCTSSGY